MTPRNPIELANAYRGKSGKNSLKESRSIKRSRIIYSYALRDFLPTNHAARKSTGAQNSIES